MNKLEELKKLIAEGKHIEFVEKFVDLSRHTKEEEEKEIKDWLKSLYDNYTKNKEILSLQEEDLMKLCCILGVYLAKYEKLKTTQIRKILDKFNRIESEFNRIESKDLEKFNIKNELIKLKPLLAYTSARNISTKELVKLLDSLITKIKDGQKGFENFKKICDLLKGVIAYHKLAGGVD